jgi:hypothetical protein
MGRFWQAFSKELLGTEEQIFIFAGMSFPPKPSPHGSFDKPTRSTSSLQYPQSQPHTGDVY